MINLKTLLSMSAATMALLALGGCLTSSPNSSGGSDISVSSTVEVLSITPPQGSEPGVIKTREVYTYCDDGDLITETDTSESNYLISGGHMLLWEEGDCLATKLTGSSSTIIGTWTATSIEATDSVPASQRPTICYEDSDDFDDYPIFDNFSAEYKISQTQIQSKMSATVCFARTFASAYEDDEDETPAFEVVSEGCSTVKIKNAVTNKTATITSGYKNDSATIKFTFENKTCTGSIYLGLAGNPTSCAANDSTSGELDEYSECVYESGFYGAIGNAKQQSLQKSMSKALKGKVDGLF